MKTKKKKTWEKLINPNGPVVMSALDTLSIFGIFYDTSVFCNFVNKKRTN